MTISMIRFWNDCGFTENCLEVPSKSNTLPTPTLIISEDSNPSKGNLFSQLRLKQPYTTLMNVSYLELTYDMNNGSDLTIYGWVDSVSVESDTSGFPLTVVDWHIDYWRTYLTQAEFGSGMVRRRFHDLGASFDSDPIPPQSYPHRYVQYAGREQIFTGDIWWVFFFYSSIFQDKTYLRWGCYPVNKSNTTTRMSIHTIGSDGTDVIKPCPSLAETTSGAMDELLEIDPESVYYCALSPLAPTSYTNTGGAISLSQWGADPQFTSGTYGWFVSGGPYNWNETTISLENPVTTTDADIYSIYGFNGEVIGSIPWGMTSSTVKARVIPISSALTIELRFGSGPNSSQVEGLTYDVICPSLDIGSNAWSSYVYSGARQADMDIRQLQAESQAVSGGISTGTSAISGAVTGALLGSAGGPVGMLGGAVVGALASAGTSLISTGANYAYQSGSYADEMQAISDYKASHQTPSLLVSGSGMDSVMNDIEGIGIVHYIYDDYSLEQRSNDIILYGANVSEPTESCQSLVDEGGPLQITNLTVTGDIPVEAKAYFRARFSKGVRMLPGPEQTEVSDE